MYSVLRRPFYEIVLASSRVESRNVAANGRKLLLNKENVENGMVIHAPISNHTADVNSHSSGT